MFYKRQKSICLITLNTLTSVRCLRKYNRQTLWEKNKITLLYHPFEGPLHTYYLSQNKNRKLIVWETKHVCIVFSQYTLQLCQSVFRDFQSQALRTVSLAITDEHTLCYFFWSFFWHIYASFFYNKIVVRCTIWLFTIKINMPAFTCFYLIALAFPLTTFKFSAYKKQWLNIPYYSHMSFVTLQFPVIVVFLTYLTYYPLPSIVDSGFSFLVWEPLFSSFFDRFSASCRCFLRCLN